MGTSGSIIVNFECTSKIYLDRFQKIYGGEVAPPRRGTYKNKKDGNLIECKTTYRWQICSDNAYRFLIDILPYLIIKKEQAELGIDYYEKDKLYESHRGRPLSDKHREFKREYTDRMKKLKKTFIRPEKLQKLYLGWIAGFFDGEGCVSIHHQYEQYNFNKIKFTNKNTYVLECIQKIFRGVIEPVDKRGVYDLRFRLEEAKYFMNTIKDYLIEKKQDVEIMNIFLKTQDQGTKKQYYLELQKIKDGDSGSHQGQKGCRLNYPKECETMRLAPLQKNDTIDPAYQKNDTVRKNIVV